MCTPNPPNQDIECRGNNIKVIVPSTSSLPHIYDVNAWYRCSVHMCHLTRDIGVQCGTWHMRDIGIQFGTWHICGIFVVLCGTWHMCDIFVVMCGTQHMCDIFDVMCGTWHMCDIFVGMCGTRHMCDIFEVMCGTWHMRGMSPQDMWSCFPLYGQIDPVLVPYFNILNSFLYFVNCIIVSFHRSCVNKWHRKKGTF